MNFDHTVERINEKSLDFSNINVKSGGILIDKINLTSDLIW